MRVHLVSSKPPPYGGVTIWTEAYLRRSSGAGLEVRLQSTGPRSTAEIFDPRARLRRLLQSTLAPVQAVLAGEARQAQVVHVCSSYGSFLRALPLVAACGAVGKAVVVHLHGMTAWSVREAALARWLTDRPWVALVTPCPEDAARHRCLTQIDNLIPDDLASGGAWAGPTPGEELRLLYLGWIIRAKGLFELARALERVPGVSVEMYGPEVRSRDREQLMTLAGRLGLAQRLAYRGEVDHPRVPDLLRRHDALVLPSHQESFGLVAAEGLKLGVPLIGTRTGLMWDLPSEALLAARVGSVDDLVSVLQRARAQKQTLLPRLSAAGSQFAARRLGEKQILDRWRSLYLELLAPGTAAGAGESRR